MPDNRDSSLFKNIQSDNLTDSLDLRKILKGLQRHILLILAFTLLFGLIGAFAAYKFLTTYKAEAIVLYQGERPETKEASFTLTYISMPTAMDMIKLPTNFQAVRSQLGLTLDPEAIEKMVSIPPPENNSNLIRIVVSGDHPLLTQDIAGTLAQVAVKNSQDFVRRELKIADDNYTRQLGIVKERLALQIQDLEDFKKAQNFFEMNVENSALLNQIDQARLREEQSGIAFNTNYVEFENLKKQLESLPDYVAGSGNSQYTSPIQSRIMALETALSEAKAKYTPDNPKVKLLESEYKSLISKSKDNKDGSDTDFYQTNPIKENLQVELIHLQSKVESSKANYEQAKRVREGLEEKLKNLPSQQMAFLKLLQSKQITEDQVKSMTDILEKIKLSINAPKGSLAMYQLPDKAKPWHDEWWVSLLPLVGILFGFGSGLFAALVMEIADPKIRTKGQADLSYNIPTIAEIPEIPFFSKYNGEKKSLFFIREIHDHLQAHSHPQKIAVTSSVNGEGKSTIAYYLARYYQLLGKKTLLVSFDKVLNPLIETKPTLSLEDYLKGKGDIDELIQQGNIDWIAIDNYPEEMRELIKSNQMKTLVNELSNRYETIVFDIPALITESSSSPLASFADANLFVVGSKHVDKTIIDQALLILEKGKTPPIGIVLNFVHPIYVQQERVKVEMKRVRSKLWEKIFFWKQ